MKTWTNTRLLAAGAMLCGLGIVFGVGATLMLAAPDGEAKKADAPEVKPIVDDYKKHYDAFKEAGYKAEKFAEKYTVTSDPLNPIAQGIMGTWISDVELTKLTGNKLRGSITMTCAPTKEPSIALLTTLEETLKEMVSEAEKMPDNKRYKDRAARFAGGVSTVYRYGNIRIEMAGRDQVIDSPFIITTFSGTPVLYHFKDAEQKRIEGISVNYRHSKSGTLDSLGIGESDETDVVFVRASALEKIAEIRSAKPEERKERPSKTDSAPREVKTEDRTKTARR